MAVGLTDGAEFRLFCLVIPSTLLIPSSLTPIGLFNLASMGGPLVSSTSSYLNPYPLIEKKNNNNLQDFIDFFTPFILVLI